MHRFIYFALEHARTAFATLILIFIAGGSILMNIPRESFPDIDIPYASITVSYSGVSPSDSQQLLLKPIENRIKSIAGIKQMTGYAREGMAQIIIEIDIDADKEQVITDIKDEVDIAVADLPADADKPIVKEISSTDVFSMVLITLSGPVPNAVLQSHAQQLQDVVEAVPGVLEAEISGEQEEQIEIIIDPVKIESYGFTLSQAVQFVQSTNQVVAAGTQDTGAGRFAIRAPGTFKSIQDMMNIVVATSGDAQVTLGDIAEFRRSYKDPESLARINGEPALVLGVKKKSGENQIDTIANVKEAVNKEVDSWPESLKALLKVSFSQDSTVGITTMLEDLVNSVTLSILLVMAVVLVALGFRAAILVAMSIPGSFLLGMIIINGQGLTLNMMVLFGLILAVGLLVDGAVVVIEYADRKMQEGVSRKEAYGLASERMFWPVASSTATTLAAFLPLLFWKGTVGDFMRYLPLTLIAILTASLFMALIFIPVLGRVIGKPGEINEDLTRRFAPGSTVEDMKGAQGIAGAYVRFLDWAVHRWFIIIPAIVVFVLGSIVFYGRHNNGSEFFPASEPDLGEITISAKGNYSLQEMDEIVKEVENRVRAKSEYKTIYTNVAYATDGSDEIGTITLEFAFWRNRRHVQELLDEIKEDTKGLAGVELVIKEAEQGPPVGKTIQLKIASNVQKDLDYAVDTAKAWLAQQEGTLDIEDSRSEQLLEMKVDVDREQAAKYGLSMSEVGIALQLLTSGVEVSKWRPDNSDDELELRVRFPEEYRSLSELENLRINSSQGSVPLSNFVHTSFQRGDGIITHIDTKPTLIVSANLKDKTKAKGTVTAFQKYLDSPEAGINKNTVSFKWEGEDAEQQEVMIFLAKAFLVAIFLIFIILLTQFNSLYASILVLLAVVMSISGALLGHLILGLKLSVIMSGVGIVALAGIVVNNNIVLIDTYQRHLAESRTALEAILRTGGQRLRPVLLTTCTTILGLVPMVTKINIDFVEAKITYNSPTSQVWVQLSSAIAFGLGFATILTLIFTPCMLFLGGQVKRKIQKHSRATDIITPLKDKQGDKLAQNKQRSKK
ncbi:MAG: efflux RND transporter permease subunit [Alphaproteobacteria bacterium]